MALIPGFMSALLIASAKGVARLVKAYANRQAAQDLTNWDARSLKDIGLISSDVSGALSLPFHRDPTHYLAQVAAGRMPMPGRDSAGSTRASHPVDPCLGRPGELPSAGPALTA